MQDEKKTEAPLVAEREEMHGRDSDLEQSEAVRGESVEAQREDEERYRLLFENANAGIIFFDTAGTYIMLNKHIATILGGKPEDFVGKSLREVFPEQAEFHLQRFAKIIRERKGATFEDPFPLPDGIRWYSSTLQPVLDRTGSVSGIQIVAIDITERKQAEEALRQHEHIVSSSTDMLALLDKRYKYLAANKAYLEAFRLTHEQLIGRSVASVFGEEFFDAVIRPNADRCMGGDVGGGVETRESGVEAALLEFAATRRLVYFLPRARGRAFRFCAARSLASFSL